MNTYNDIQLLQARKALEEVNNCSQIRADRAESQNLHCVHFGCQADCNHFLKKNKTSANENNGLHKGKPNAQLSLLLPETRWFQAGGWICLENKNRISLV